MKLVVSGLLAIACFAGSPTRSPQLAPITLFLQHRDAVPAAILESLKEEVAAILAPVGFRFEWHDISTSQAVGPAVELAVVTFRGHCELPALPARLSGNIPAQALGFTSVTDGEVLPFATVDCDRSGSFLSEALRRLPVHDRPAAYGRALGRILAHELFHVFARTQAHGHAGIAKEAYSVSDLLADEFELAERECALLRTSPAYTVLSDAMRQP
jgi:hypothetical protein